MYWKEVYVMEVYVDDVYVKESDDRCGGEKVMIDVVERR